MRQEPGSNEEIQSFCRLNYGVTFPMFAKIAVKGSNQHPLYTWLTAQASTPEGAGKISWNFNKFLISRDGKVIGRFGSRTAPDDKELLQPIKDTLVQ
jgi:glutathione peroxidase